MLKDIVVSFLALKLIYDTLFLMTHIIIMGIAIGWRQPAFLLRTKNIEFIQQPFILKLNMTSSFLIKCQCKIRTFDFL